MFLSLILSSIACLLTLNAQAMGPKRSFAIHADSIAPPSASFIQYSQAEPLWETLSFSPKFYKESWSSSPKNLEIFKFADEPMIYALQMKGAELWEEIRSCAGFDPALARERYRQGDYCPSQPELASKMQEYHSSVGSALATMVVNPNELELFHKTYWGDKALRVSALFTQILYEHFASASLFIETVDYDLLRNLQRKGWNNKNLKDVRWRMRIADSATRLLSLFTLKCADHGFWPSFTSALHGSENAWFAMVAIVNPSVKIEWTSYSSKASVLQMMACGETVIRDDLDFWQEHKSRLDQYRYGGKPAKEVVEFYRHLSIRHYQNRR